MFIRSSVPVKEGEEVGIGKGSCWIMNRVWQSPNQNDEELWAMPSELSHVESELLGLYMSTLLSYQVVARENSVTSDGSL